MGSLQATKLWKIRLFTADRFMGGKGKGISDEGGSGHEHGTGNGRRLSHAADLLRRVVLATHPQGVADDGPRKTPVNSFEF